MPRKKLTPVIPSTRLFVLDTNVLLHDPHSTLKFREHDVFVPFVTLEELDGKKAGREDLNRNARQATRLLNDIVMQPGFTMETGFPLQAFNGGSATGNLFVQREALAFLSNEHVRKNDNLYLSVLADLKTRFPGREVVLVTKDLNLRIKARAMDFAAEDFLHDHALEDADLIYRGWRHVPDEQFAKWGADLKSWRAGRVAHYSIPLSGEEQLNEFLVFPDKSLYRVVELREATAVLQAVEDTTKEKNAVMGICARNEEQRAALSLLQDEDVDLVTLLGPAGTGKTLLALAAAFKQVMAGTYDTILFTRAHAAGRRHRVSAWQRGGENQSLAGRTL
jgi:PhoH-like ATPase